MCLPFCQLGIESKFIIIWLIPVGKYPCLTGYSYLQHVLIFVVCTLKFLVTLVDSHISKLQNRGISTKTSTSTIYSKKLMPFNLEVPRPSYPCFVITSRTFAIVGDENILTNTHINPSQVGQKIPFLTTQMETLTADKHDC